MFLPWFLALATLPAFADDPCPFTILPVEEERLHGLATQLDLNINAVSPGSYEALFSQGVGVATFGDPAARALAAIFLSPVPRSHAETKSALNEWVHSQTTWHSLAFPDDIVAAGNKYAQEGRLRAPPGGWIIRTNGLVDSQLYALLVAEGRFPVADPHDLYAHLLSLSDPNFNLEFHRQMDLTYAAARAIRFVPIQEIGAYLGGRNSTRSAYLRAQALVFHQIQTFVRDGTQENWTFLREGANGATEFHGQGNKPFNGYLALRQGNGDAFIRGILNGEYRTARKQIEELPGLAEFRNDPKRADVLAAYLAALDGQGADLENLDRSERLLRSAVPNQWRIGTKPPAVEVDAVKRRIIEIIANDTWLRSMFSYAKRWEYYRASNDFYREYLEFAETTLAR